MVSILSHVAKPRTSHPTDERTLPTLVGPWEGQRDSHSVGKIEGKVGKELKGGRISSRHHFFSDKMCAF